MSRARRFIAIAAAYAVALQALLAAFAPAVALAASDTPFVVCKPRADTGGDPAQPIAHESCLACLAGHCAASGLAPVASVVPAPTRLVAAVAMPRPTMPLPSAPRGQTYAARAPPAA